MINKKFMPNFIMDIIRYANDEDIETLLTNSKAKSYQWYSQYAFGKDVSKGRLLACLFDYIYEFIEPDLFVEPELVVENNEIIEDLLIPAPQNLSLGIANHKLLYLHLYALSECYHSYQVYFPGEDKKKMYIIQKIYAKKYNANKNKKALTEKDIAKLLHIFINSYTENGFYYYFYDDELVKLEIKKFFKHNKADYRYVKTTYKLKDIDKVTYIINKELDINVKLKQKLIRNHRKKFAQIEINPTDDNFIEFFENLFAVCDFQEAKNIHEEIIKVLKKIPKEKCKCCNPDVNKPNSTKVCDSCKQLFIKFQDLQNSIDEVTNSSYLFKLKHQNIKGDVYKVSIDNISDLNKLRKKRKKFLNDTIQKIMKEVDKAKIKADGIARKIKNDNHKDYTNYTKIMNIIEDLKVLISDIFDN